MTLKSDLRSNVISYWKSGDKNRTVRITGTSMVPFIFDGYSITFSPASKFENMMIGDIAVFHRGSCLIAHRIVDKIVHENKIIFKEKGDNNFYPMDIAADDIVGKVIIIDTGKFVINLTRWYWRIVCRLLGYYWKTLFVLLTYIQESKHKIFGQKKLYAVNVLFQKIVHFLIRLPHIFFRSK